MPTHIPLVSILLPSVRPEAVAQRIADFAASDGDVDYEIVVVSEFEIAGKNVVHVPETVRKGACGAQTEAYLHSRGEFVVWMSDDAIPTPHCIRNIVSFVRARPSPFIASFRYRDAHVQMQERGQGVIYGKVFANWGCASRQTIEALGGFFDPAYRALFCDPDLSMRCWQAGGRVEPCPTAWILHNNITDELAGGYRDKWTEIDGKVFHDRWDPVFMRKGPNHMHTKGGLAPPLPFRMAPILWARWYYPQMPALTAGWALHLRALLYGIAVRLPVYPLYRWAKDKFKPSRR